MSENNSQTILHDRYQLESLIARGGMAEVHLALDTQLNRKVAVKILFPEYAREESFVERFRREAQAAANLNHPNIVAIYDWGQSEGTYFIVMEYVKGRSLKEILTQDGPLDSDLIAEYSSDITSALAYAHQNGVVHRDVKPGNILITENGKVKVTDFGIARAGTSESLTQTGSVMGTATYFSPEQAQGYNVDGRSDIYSLGIVMYELATGAPPFSADTPIAVAFKHVSEKLVPPSVRNPDIAADFEAIIQKCLEKDPDRRYSNANDVHDDCVRFIRRRPVMAAKGMPVDADATVMNAALVDDDLLVDTGRTQVVAKTQADKDEQSAIATNAYEFAPPSRKGPTIIVISLIVLLILAIGAVFAISALGDKTPSGPQTVPDVIGKTKEEARKQLSDLGFEVKVNIEVNESVEAGLVYAQDPEAGIRLRPGNTVTISVSAGIGKSDVPDVKGQSINDATLALEEAGFVAIPKEEESDSVEKDKVVRTNPRAGTELERGSEVEVYVSLGPSTVTVLNVVGLKDDIAIAQLSQEDFQVVTQEEASDTVAVGIVIRTDPVANTKAPRASTVTIFVSTGPSSVTVPSVVGKTEDEAVALIQSTVGGAVKINSVSGNAGNKDTVRSQSPSAGTKVNKGSQVTIDVFRFPFP
jgi:beta-lactam-binding protein with PASTA domain/tRNA A-37 threonylcarbamoyl transferase component Bud32